MSNKIEEEKIIEKVDFTFKKIDIDNDIMDEYNDLSKHRTKHEVVTYEGSNKVTLKKRLYINFSTRITIYVIAILVLFLMSSFCFYKVYKAAKNYVVHYSEKSSINYNVCDKDGNCIDSKNITGYLSENCDKINTHFNYNLDISDKISYDVSYFIKSEYKITSKKKKNIVLYEKEEEVVDLTRLKNEGDNISINEDVVIDYGYYYGNVGYYEEKNNVDVNAELVYTMYLKDKKDIIKLSTMKLDLNDNILVPKITNIEHLNKSVNIEKDVWTNSNIVFTFICIISGLLSLLMIIRLSNLMVKVFNRKDKYKKEVKKILRTYDKDIVVARDGYVSMENKTVVKVTKFKELLDAKTVLDKPIVYVRVNDIKSKFIVEDVDSIYEYTIKDLDF